MNVFYHYYYLLFSSSLLLSYVLLSSFYLLPFSFNYILYAFFCSYYHLLSSSYHLFLILLFLLSFFLSFIFLLLLFVFLIFNTSGLRHLNLSGWGYSHPQHEPLISLYYQRSSPILLKCLLYRLFWSSVVHSEVEATWRWKFENIAETLGESKYYNCERPSMEESILQVHRATKPELQVATCAFKVCFISILKSLLFRISDPFTSKSIWRRKLSYVSTGRIIIDEEMPYFLLYLNFF